MVLELSSPASEKTLYSDKVIEVIHNMIKF